MPELLSAAEWFRKEAAKFSDLAKNASNPFVRDYYQRIAQRYLLHAGGPMEPGNLEGGSNTERGRL
jgi:hypothetical protein